MAITLLSNAANKTSLMRRSRILEEYNRELVHFAVAQERDRASAAPRLRLNFLKEAADYLQQLKLIRKVNSKPTPKIFWHPPPPPPNESGKRGQRTKAMEAATILSTKTYL